MLTIDVVFLHDNAHPYSARETQELLKQFKWEISDDLPYSLDMAIFTQMKKILASQNTSMKTTNFKMP